MCAQTWIHWKLPLLLILGTGMAKMVIKCHPPSPKIPSEKIFLHYTANWNEYTHTPYTSTHTHKYIHTHTHTHTHTQYTCTHTNAHAPHTHILTSELRELLEDLTPPLMGVLLRRGLLRDSTESWPRPGPRSDNERIMQSTHHTPWNPKPIAPPKDDQTRNKKVFNTVAVLQTPAFELISQHEGLI